MSPFSALAVAASLFGVALAIQAPSARLQTRASTPTEALVTLPQANAVQDPVDQPSAPAPAPVVEPVPVQHRVRHSPVRAARPLAGRTRHDWLVSGDGTLNTGVGLYTDCSGTSELTHEAAAIDTCVPGPTYFVGHNAGVFAPLMHLGINATITYFDAAAVAHTWRVVSVRPRWRAADGAPPPTQPDVIAQFQTCAVPDGSLDRILDVVPA
jgi:hypothetical protein